MVDHIYYGATTSEENLYQSNVIAAVIGQISDGTEGSYKQVDVTAAVQADLEASKDRSQFRLYHYPDPTNWGLTDSHISTWATGDHATYPAQLVITYPAS